MKKRVLCLFISLVLCLSLLPADALAAEARPALAGDVWSSIEALEQEGMEGYAVLMDAGTDPAKDPDYYASLSGEVEALVTARPDCEPGSVIRHGDFFFWKDTAGVVYGYSPDLRAQLNGACGPEDVPEEPAAQTTDTEATEAEIAALERAQTARTETAPAGAALMGGTTTDPDVAVFIPHYPNSDSKFTKSAYFRGLQIAEATGGTCTCFNGSDVTIDLLAEALTENGVILFHTHGSTDAYYAGRSDPGNTAYLTIKNGTGIDWTGKDGKLASGTYGDYYHVYKSGDDTWCIDGTAIVNHVKGTVVTDLFGLCCCMGMKNDGLCRPLREAGVELVYGYSQSVTFTTDLLHQKFLAEALVNGLDGGGIARYMKEQMCQDVLEHWNLTEKTRKNLTALGSVCWDPYKSAYPVTEKEAQDCGSAFLLFCSSEDPYPAEGQRDRAQTVRSAWKLSLEGGGTGSGTFRAECWTGVAIEQFFPNVTKIEAISGTLPGSVAIRTRSFGGDEIDALSGNVGLTPGLFEADFRVTFTDGTTGTRRTEILVMNRMIQSTEQTASAEPGTEQEIKLAFKDPGKVYDYEMLSGELPPGMSDVWNKISGLSLRGTPTVPGWYVSVWRVTLSSGKVIDHTLRVHVAGTVAETSESLLISIYDDSKHELDAKAPSAVVQTDLLSGALPPGMDWGCSMSEAPYLSGRPSQEGSFSARFRFLCSDGTIEYHTVSITAFEPGHALSSYTVYVGGGEALVPKKEFDEWLLHSLMGAVNARQIRWNLSGNSVLLDLDNSGGYDVIATSPTDGNYVLFRKISGCSITEDTFRLTLTSAALTQASHFGDYTEEIVFRLADKFDLYVDGVQVTTENMQDILGNGVFSFDGGITLSVHGDHLAIGDEPVIRNKMANLIVQVEEDSLLSSAAADCIRAENSMTIRGPGKLTLETPENGILTQALLELLNLDLEISAGKKGITGEDVGTPHLRVIRSNVDIDSGTGAVYDFWSVGLDHSLIAEPVYGQVENPLPASAASYLCLVDEDRSLIDRVNIRAYSKEYDLWINGIRVTDQNQMDVLGDGKFSYAEYDYGNAVLSISGSLESSKTIVESEIDGLRIITAPDTVLKTSRWVCMNLSGDTTLSGGPLSVISTSRMGVGINVQSGSTLIVSLTDLTVEGGRYGINAEAYAGNGLYISSSNVTASGPSGAIRGFTNGIDRSNCTLLLPAGSQISDGTVMDGEKPAVKAVIGRASISVSETNTLTYALLLPGSGTATLIAAWYDGNGVLLGTALTEETRGAFVSGTIPVKSGANHYKLFVLDENAVPLLAELLYIG